MAYLTASQRERKRERDREYQRKRRAALKAGKVTAKVAQKIAPVAPVLTNRIAIVVDRSGSMSQLRNTVVDQLNEQIANIKKEAYKSGQRTYVSVYTFSGRDSMSALTVNSHPEAVKMFTYGDYYPNGQTALRDAILRASADLQGAARGEDKDTSFLLIVITDGQENSSMNSEFSVQDKIARLQGTDQWTFVALVPPGGRSSARRLGIPDGNIREWEGTQAGWESASRHTVASTSAYYASRAAGRTKTTAFFTDLSNIGQRDLNKLDDLQGQFRRLPVKAETNISDFVESNGIPYVIGKAFYQLTKPEKVQAHKEFVIEDRSTKHLYGGDQARKLLGIVGGPGVTVNVRPGNHANYNLFVQSTSMNRKLVRGTTVLYKR